MNLLPNPSGLAVIDDERKGAAMHHCIGTYVDAVRCNVSAELSEIRGPCNAQVPEQTLAAVRRWSRAQPPLPWQSNGLLMDGPRTVATLADDHGFEPSGTSKIAAESMQKKGRSKLTNPSHPSPFGIAKQEELLT
jgi:hypothetical protein